MAFDLYNPTEQHAMLRRTVREFVQREVEPQALEHDREERFNLPLFRRAFERIRGRADDQHHRDPRKRSSGGGKVAPQPPVGARDDLPRREKDCRAVEFRQSFLDARIVRSDPVRQPDRVPAQGLERTRPARLARAGRRAECAECEKEQSAGKPAAFHEDTTGASRVAAASGSSKRTRNPPPLRFCAVIVPPCSSTIFLAIARPRPVPPLFAEK